MISAPLIVKNEAPRLQACLGSLRGTVDEIVILDTGSTDDTPAVAKLYADRVYESKRFTAKTAIEDFHFADARNEVLDKCRGDWVLSVDADEIVHDGGLRQFCATATVPNALVSLRMKDRARLGRTAYVPRLFQRAGVHWRGRYHDLPAPWDHENEVRLDAEVCWIENRGGGNKDKMRRNIILLKKQQAEEKRVGYTIWQIADSYRALGVATYPEALGYYLLFMAHCGDRIGDAKAYVLCSIADCYSRMGAMAEAIDYAQRLIRQYPHYERGYLVLAETYDRLGQWDIAISYYQRALRLKDPMPLHPLFSEGIDREAIENRVMLCDHKMHKEDPVC